MPRRDPFQTVRINIPLRDALEDRRKKENFPGKLNIYAEWLLQQIVDGKIVVGSTSARSGSASAADEDVLENIYGPRPSKPSSRRKPGRGKGVSGESATGK